ncbi:MAG TPA: Gfo/Idh/MocA family oxidoreductase [Planctomycetota bacterium]|nr:Gfo/Idh/MocA family oxidoreductase [Planctomycetota bacterium]
MPAIRLGLIGCGNIESTHEAAALALAGDVEIVATADVQEDRAVRAARRVGARHAATRHADILPHVDAVVIALPHDLHHLVGLDCLTAGKHVLMEKPLAITERDCLELVRAGRQAGRVLMTGYLMRFHPLVLALKERIDAKVDGDAFQVSIWTEQHTEPPPGHWIRSAQRLGGGQFLSHGCHYVDLLLWLLGRPESGTHVGTRLGTPWLEGEGTSNAAIAFAGGAVGYHFGTWGARGTRLRSVIHVHATEGMLEADLSRGRLALVRGADERVLLETGTVKPALAQLAHFVASIRDGARPLTDGAASVQSLRVIWRLYDAERRGVVADLRGLGLDDLADAPDVVDMRSP